MPLQTLHEATVSVDSIPKVIQVSVDDTDYLICGDYKGKLITSRLNADLSIEVVNSLAGAERAIASLVHLIPQPGFPNGAIAGGVNDGTVRIWLMADVLGSAASAGSVLQTFSQRVTFLKLSADGGHLLAASQNATARVFSIDGSECLTLSHEVAGEDETGNRLISSVVELDDGFLTGCQDGSIRKWSKAGDLVFAQEHVHAVVRGMQVVDGMLVTVGRDGAIKFWSLRPDGFEPISSIEFDGRTSSCQILCPSKLLAWGSDAIYVLEDGHVVDYFVSCEVWSVCVLRTGQIVFSGRKILGILEDRPGHSRPWPRSPLPAVPNLSAMVRVLIEGRTASPLRLLASPGCDVYTAASDFIQRNRLPLRHLEPIARYLRDKFEGVCESPIHPRFQPAPIVGDVLDWEREPGAAFRKVTETIVTADAPTKVELLNTVEAICFLDEARRFVPPERLVEFIAAWILPDDAPENAFMVLANLFLRYADEIIRAVIESNLIQKVSDRFDRLGPVAKGGFIWLLRNFLSYVAADVELLTATLPALIRLIRTANAARLSEEGEQDVIHAVQIVARFAPSTESEIAEALSGAARSIEPV
jgi:hypothetical protein